MLRTRDREGRFVLRARSDFDHCGHVVANGAESPDDSKVAALIGEELHLSVSMFVTALTDEHHFFFFASDGIGREPHCRLPDTITELKWYCEERRDTSDLRARCQSDGRFWRPIEPSPRRVFRCSTSAG